MLGARVYGFRSVKGYDRANDAGVFPTDKVHSFTNRFARRQHIIQHQHPALYGGAYQMTALPMGLGFLAVISHPDVHTLLSESQRRCYRYGYALVSRPKQQVEFNTRGNDGIGIGAPQGRKRCAGGNRPHIKKVGTAAPRLQRKIAKLEHLLCDQKFNKFRFVCHQSIAPN